MSELPEGWCWQLRITLPKNLRFRQPEYNSFVSHHMFLSRAKAIESMENIWDNLMSCCDLKNCTWEDGVIELVLAPIPDAATLTRRLALARGPPILPSTQAGKVPT